MRSPEYKRTLMHINGTNNDIINAIESNFNKAVEQVSDNDWYKQFEGNSLKETCNNVWRFIKLNVPYQEDGVKEQKIKLPARTLADASNGIGTDCKSFALLSAAIMSKFAPVSFRYVSYRNDPTPTHVYCIVDDGRYIIDAVWKYPNSEKPYKYKYDHKMKISTLSGIPEKKVKIDKHSYDILLQLRNAIQMQKVGSPMYHKLQQQFEVVSNELGLKDATLPIGKFGDSKFGKGLKKVGEYTPSSLLLKAGKKLAPKLKKAAQDIKHDLSKKDKPEWASNKDYAKHLVKAVSPLFVEMRASFMLLLTLNYRDLCNRILAKNSSDPHSMERLWYVGFGGDPKALLAACEANKKKKALFGRPKTIHGVVIAASFDDEKAKATADQLTNVNKSLQSGGGDAAKAAALSASLGTAATAGAAALGLAGPQAAAVGAAAALAATIVATFIKHIGKDNRELTDPDATFDPNLDTDGDGIPDIKENGGEETTGLLNNKTLLIGGAAAVALLLFMKKK